MDRMTHTPNSATEPKAGSKYKVCYDFTGLPSSVTNVTLHVYATPPNAGDPQVIEILRGSGGETFCKEVQSAVGDIVHTIDDQSGNSDDHGVDLH